MIRSKNEWSGSNLLQIYTKEDAIFCPGRIIIKQHLGAGNKDDGAIYAGEKTDRNRKAQPLTDKQKKTQNNRWKGVTAPNLS